MSEMFETLMLICFGLSWPMSVVKSYRSRTAQGKSIFFQIAIIIGYMCGIMSKLTASNINYVLALYLLNLLMVSVDLALYFRNRKLGSGREQETPQVAQDSLQARFKAAENSPLRGQRKIAVASCFFGKIGIR